MSYLLDSNIVSELRDGILTTSYSPGTARSGPRICI
jgi:hypothetical protein